MNSNIDTKTAGSTVDPAVNPNTNRNVDPKKMRTAVALTHSLIAAAWIVAGVFVGFPISAFFFAFGAGHMALAMCAVKNPLPLLAVIPSVAAALISQLYWLIFVVLFWVCLVSVTVVLCVSRGMNKTKTVLISAAVTIVMLAIMLVLIVVSFYGTISVDAFVQLEEDFNAFWVDTTDKLIDEYHKTYKSTIEKSAEAGMSFDVDAELKKLDEAVKELRIIREEYYRIIFYILPALIIVFANMFGYFASGTVFKNTAMNPFLKIRSEREKGKITIEPIGALIFGIACPVFFLAGIDTAPGLVALNLFVVYLPALTVIGARNTFTERASRMGCISLLLIFAVIFINPYLTVIMLAYVGAWSIIKKEMDEFLKKRMD